MKLIRREFLRISGIAIAFPSFSNIAIVQSAGPRLTQILREDLEAQGNVVQVTVVSVTIP